MELREVLSQVSTGDIGGDARRYANRVMQDSNLCIVMIDRPDLEAIKTNPASIVDAFKREAHNAMSLKKLERLKRKWVCSELAEEYLQGALGRFDVDSNADQLAKLVRGEDEDSNYYRLPHPGILWNGAQGDKLPDDGGRKRPLGRKKVVTLDGSDVEDKPKPLPMSARLAADR